MLEIFASLDPIRSILQPLPPEATVASILHLKILAQIEDLWVCNGSVSNKADVIGVIALK